MAVIGIPRIISSGIISNLPSAKPLSQTVLYGGQFQDSAGNPLSLGYITLTLSHDSAITFIGSNGGSQVVGGIAVTLNLDASGNVAGSTSVWTNDLLLPSGSYYVVRAYNSSGLEVWSSPQIWVLTYAPGINVGSILPTTP